MIQVTNAITSSVVMVTVIAAILVAVLVLFNARTKERGRLYDLLNRAQELKQPLPLEVVEQLADTSQTGKKNGVRRWTVVIAMAGLGIAAALAFGMVLQDDLGDTIDDLALPVMFLGVIAALLAVVVVPQRNRMKERARLYDMLSQAHERGQPILPEVVQQLTSSSLPAPERDIRRGMILLAIGAGLGMMTITAEVLSSTSFLFFLLPAGVLAGLGVAFLMLGRRRPPGGA
jgi:hypothetical protein